MKAENEEKKKLIGVFVFCLFVLFNYELFSFSARIVPEMHFFRSDKESTQPR